MKDMGEILHKEFEPIGYNVPTREAPKFVLQLVSLFDKSVQIVVADYGKQIQLDNKRVIIPVS